MFIGALAFVYVACSGRVARLIQNINARDEPRRLLVLEVSDALVDLAIFYASFMTGNLKFANDPGNVIMIVLAVLSGLSIVVVVVEMLIFTFRIESFVMHAPIVLIASLLVEDLFQLVMYILISLSLNDINAPVVIGIVKAGLVMLSKLAKIFPCERCNSGIQAASEVAGKELETADRAVSHVARLRRAEAEAPAPEQAPAPEAPAPEAPALEYGQTDTKLGGQRISDLEERMSYLSSRSTSSTVRLSKLEGRMLHLEEKVRLLGGAGGATPTVNDCHQA